MYRRALMPILEALFILTSVCMGSTATLAEVSSFMAKQAEAVEIKAIELNQQQRGWLAQHPIIRVGVDPDFAPYEFIDAQKKHSGISSDYLKELSMLLGVTFEVVPDLSWQQVLSASRNKKIDMLSAATPTPERQNFLKFTNP